MALRRLKLQHWFTTGPLQLIFKNAGILLSGKSVAGLCNLGSLALAARALGPDVFGTLILIHTVVRLIIGILKFQSWQAVIRYGAISLHTQQHQNFHGLIIFTVLLDAVSAVLGTTVAILAVPLIAPYLGWSDDVTSMAMLYSIVILFSVTATPIGILRLFNRFDLLSIHATISPGIRLIGASVIYFVGIGLWGFLSVWFIAGVVGGIVLVVMGWCELRKRELIPPRHMSFRNLTQPHPGLWRFVFATNIQSSLELTTGHLTTLVVGWVLGPTAAGLFKIAKELSTVLSRAGGLLAESIYPELAKLSTQEQNQTFRRVIVRSGLVAGGGATIIFLGMIVLGEPLLRLTVGTEFVGAYPLLLLLILAETIGAFGFGLNSAMYAIGRAGIPLQVNVTATVLYLPLLFFFLTQMSTIGAGIAFTIFSATRFVAMATITTRLLRRGKTTR
ncbi:MAG TPA: lipopolysaccharide biosynthesis protein [Nitrospirales bacterium]|nr:lipopolysaccharide biosynthesis protein [Nitrospirales bacterium]HIB53227.1 lipopolysaccharide biosynthesis protein [Nitrospirales bacterium]HIO21570.1 lipopolysaccharide biosynthesis protein [Nitrospirales bacterium]